MTDTFELVSLLLYFLLDIFYKIEINKYLNEFFFIKVNTINSIKGEKGDSCKEQCVKKEITFKESIQDLSAEKGSKNFEGITGKPGKDGLDGLIGPMGPVGQKGEPGLSINGEKGSKGNEGTAGSRGFPGLKGERGPGCENCKYNREMIKNELMV